MVKIESCLMRRMLSSASHDRSFINFPVHIYSSHKSDLALSVGALKAVYAHFSQSNRRIARKNSSQEVNEKLHSDMQNAKKTFQKMRHIQEDLNQAYQELMAVYRMR